MRIFTERDDRSPFYGEHIIYDTEAEFEEKNPGMKWKKWGFFNIEDLQVGDWVRADDGYIVQVLRIRTFQYKDYKNVYYVRFPMGTFAVHWREGKKEWRFRQLLAQFTPACKNSLSGRARAYRGIRINKIKFATLLTCGVRPITALKMAFPKNKFNLLTKQQLLGKAVKIMSDEVVRTEITNQLQKFNKDIIQKFGDERMVKELDDLLAMSKKGSDAHRGNIQFILELRGLYSKSESKKVNKVKEVAYEEVPPSEAEV